MTTIHIELPDATVQAARDAGLLAPQALDRLLIDALKRREAADERVKARVEEKPADMPPIEAFVTDDPAFGIWRDREDMTDVEAHVRRLRASRFNRDGSRNEPT